MYNEELENKIYDLIDEMLFELEYYIVAIIQPDYVNENQYIKNCLNRYLNNLYDEHFPIEE